MRLRHALIVILVVTLAGAAATVGLLWQGRPGTEASAGTGAALIGGPFSLTDQHGRRVTEQDFAGRYMLVYFGYTFCPDFCPMSLSTMTEALGRLPAAAAAQVVPVFISVDPERDTVEQLARYAPLFHPRLVALTGTPEEVAAAAKAYRIYYAKGKGEGDAYAVDHSTFIYLMGPDGRYVGHFGHDATPEEIAARLTETLGQS
jgi:protein SCO1/2